MAATSASTVSNDLLGPISLPLFKLSHCTMSSPGANMLWTHFPNRDNMFAVFDKVRSRGSDGVVIEKEVLKLIREGDIFETIEFELLKHEARLDESRAQSQSIPDHLLSVIIIVKKPLLALRYRLPDGQVRKIQMNFRPESGCDTAVEIFKPLGLPMRDHHQSGQGRPPLQLPQFSSQTLLVSSPHGSQEPKSALSTSHSDIGSNTQPHGIQSQPSPSREGSEILVPPSIQPPRDISSTMRYNDPNNFSKPITFIHDPRSQLERPRSDNCASYKVPSIFKIPSISRSGSLSAPFGSTDHAIIVPPSPRALLPSPVFGSQSSSLEGYEIRPVSAPETQPASCLTDSVPVSQMLPPVRELPFPREIRSRAVEVSPTLSAEPATILHANDKITQPKRKRAPAKSKVAQTKKGPKSSVSKGRAKKVKIANSKSDEVPASSALLENPTEVREGLDRAIPSSGPTQMSSIPQAPGQTVSKISEDSTVPCSKGGGDASKKRSLSVIDNIGSNKWQHQVPLRQSSPALQRAEGRPSMDFASIDPAGFLNSLDGWIRKYHDLPVPTPPITASDQLAKYASQSDEDRFAAVDSMICDCLQDENFGKLVDDLEDHWKRICLGF